MRSATASSTASTIAPASASRRPDAEPASPPGSRRADLRQLDLVAEALAQNAVQIAQAVDQAELRGFAPGPDLALEQFRVRGAQPIAAPLAHRRL